MIYIIILAFISYILLSYFLWKELRHDYINRQIFGFSFFIIVLTILFSIATYLINNSLWFLGGTAGLVSSFFFLSKYFGIKKIELLDCFVHAVLIVLIFNLICYYIFIDHNPQILYLTSILFVVYLMYKFIKVNYKKFYWYKSGRMGLAGLSVIYLVFMLRFLIAMFLPDMVTFEGRLDAYVSLSMAIVSVYGIIRLSKS